MFWHRLQRRLRLGLDKAAVERELDEELRTHVDMETGARRHGGRPLEDAAADARYALRGLRHSPGFALAAVLTLALGIGASTAVFSAANAVLLAPLPYPAPERLVRIFQQNAPTNRWTVSNADWQALRDQRPPSLASVALLQQVGAALSTPSGAQWVRVARVTAGFFTTLGVPMARGPGLRDGDDAPGAPPLVVVSEAFAAQ